MLLPALTVYAEHADFPEPDVEFNTHRQAVLEYLDRHAMPQRTPEAVRLNLPFDLPARDNVPYRGKFLLIHGLNDSTYVWRDTAIELSQRGFDVRAILLPGHGSTPKAMLDVSYREWLTAAREHFDLWYTGNEPFYLGGFSLGGVLATVLALENPQVSGLLLFSPAYRSKLDHYLRWSWLYARFRPWVFGGMILEDNPVKYNSIPVNSGSQFYRSTRYLKRQLSGSELAMPALLVTTENDSVVDVDHVRRLFRDKFAHPQSRLVLYSDRDGEIAGEREIVRDSRRVDLRILNQSHLGMMNAPGNPLFGTSRRILVCNGNEYPVFMACMRSTRHWYGAQHTASPDGVPVARSTYNPDFDFVFEEFDRVFKTP